MSIAYTIEIDNSKIENFSELVNKIFEAVTKAGQELVKQHIETIDVKILEQRDKKKYRVKGIRKTSVKTRLGTVEYERRIYLDTENHSHIYLADEMFKTRCIGLFDEELCKNIEETICNQSYRAAAETISAVTGQKISHQAVWNIVQKLGEKEIKLSALPAEAGKADNRIISKILYEEADGDWLKLQGKDRAKYGVSKEMKIGIAYDGVLYQEQKNGEKRRKLDNKIAYASFETISDFRKHCENLISRAYNVDEIELRVKNGDGAAWIQKSSDCDCICVLDKFHRNKKLTECVQNKELAENLRELLFQNNFDELLNCIEAYTNSTEDSTEEAKLRELYSYYSEHKEALAGYYDRNIAIPPTRDPGVVHHARLGSMESNVFTLIGNRMKGRRACWSVKGANNLAALLCKHNSDFVFTSGYEPVETDSSLPVLSAAAIKETSGKGYAAPHNVSFSPSMKCLRDISRLKNLEDFTV